MESLPETLARLATAIAAAPESPEPRRVLADLLLERGHPVGELMQLELRERYDRRWFDLLAEHEAAFAELVAPGADVAWLHRGLPEVAWYRSVHLREVPPSPLPFLRQLFVRVAAGHGTDVLTHASLRHLKSLTLACDVAGEKLEARLPAPLHALTLVDAAWSSLTSLLQSGRSTLRRLRLVTTGGEPLTRALRPVLDARLTLEELELDGFSLTDATQPLADAVRALAPQQVVLRGNATSGAERFSARTVIERAGVPFCLVLLGPSVGGLDPQGVSSGPWHLGTPASDATGTGLLRHLGSDFTLDAFQTAQGHTLSLLPLLRHDDEDRVFQAQAFVRELRAWLCSASPPFAHVQRFGFEDAAPFQTFEDVPGVLLLPSARKRPCGPTAELFRAAASLALSLGPSLFGQLTADGVALPPEGALRVTSPYARAAREPPGTGNFSPEALVTYSKEAARGHAASEASHTYAVALLVYVACCGQLPQRDASTAYAVLSSTLADDFVPLEERVRVDERAAAAVLAGLKSTSTLSALAQALTAAADRAPSGAWGPSAFPEGVVVPPVTLWPAWRVATQVT